MNLENMFSKYASVPDKMTLGDLWHMTEGNRVIFDVVGWFVFFTQLEIQSFKLIAFLSIKTSYELMIN